uniref:Uncharacterized protein n=1 Tax=Rhinopithecus bieti TaxID=61621 RepID=A0A2K6L453_RHIBE
MFLQYYLNEEGDRVYTPSCSVLPMTNTPDTESPSKETLQGAH